MMVVTRSMCYKASDKPDPGIKMNIFDRYRWGCMEALSRGIWDAYAPNLPFVFLSRADPLEVGKLLDSPHWGRFVAYSIWLQKNTSHWPTRIQVYKALTRVQPKFIPSIWVLLKHWIWGKLCPRSGGRRRRRRSFFPDT